MPSCVFRRCTNYDSKVNKIQGITYHMFPSDQVKLQDWIAIVREQRSESDWIPSKSSRICSNHFKSTYKYVSKKGRILLTKNAVPFIQEQKIHNVQDSPSSLDNVSLPELGEVLETPRKSALRRRVRLLTFKKKQLQKKNKTLTQRNKRLKKRIASVAVILKDLKTKNYISKEQFSELKLKSDVIDLINRIFLKKKSRKSYRVKYPPALLSENLHLHSIFILPLPTNM